MNKNIKTQDVVKDGTLLPEGGSQQQETLLSNIDTTGMSK